ncbi:cytochrome P450 [Kutzneria albida]|uniref:Cytochrome P450 n=1 Tax=Kutzneria albida DSM 43870 TaxID=1449976 RepID=W5WGC3_9PSEU|nr:cytochrome P450 [Kutzneria albida]AHH99621.1 hypothetical protein KALB_6261 [Kutzneria albida DSM 43870]
MTRLAPGPRGLPLLGSGPDLVRDLVGTFTRGWREHGDVVRFRVPGKELFLLVDPEHVKHVLADNQPIYPKDPQSVGKFEEFVGQGLFTSNGEFHFRHRRLAQPAFQGTRIAGFAPDMVAAAEDLVRDWRPLAWKESTVDIVPEMMRLALTIVMRTLFSTDVSAQAGHIAAAVRTCNAYTNLRLQRFVELPRIGPSRRRREFAAARARLDEFVYALVARRRAQGTDSSRDLLSLYLAARDEQSGYRMSDRQLRDEVVTIFLGGYETTALSLVWTFWLLARHPDVERRVRAELEHVLGGHEPTAADLPRLEYLRAVYAEALRLYPPVWTLSRTPLREDVIGGYRVPRGAQVFISPYLVHRHPGHWPDAERFDPDRFLGKRPGGWAYLPFARGPRVCPGSSIAWLEGPLVLATILRSYRLTVPPTHQVRPRSNVFLYPSGGMPMRIEEVEP